MLLSFSVENPNFNELKDTDTGRMAGAKPQSSPFSNQRAHALVSF
jgi:hypothetical protein